MAFPTAAVCICHPPLTWNLQLEAELHKKGERGAEHHLFGKLFCKYDSQKTLYHFKKGILFKRKSERVINDWIGDFCEGVHTSHLVRV